MNYEPVTPIDIDYLNGITTIEWLQYLHNYYRLNYEPMPFAERDYHMARQFFVRRVCKLGFTVMKAFQLIEQETKKCDLKKAYLVCEIVENNLFQELSSIERDWALEQMEMDMQIVIFTLR